MSTAAKFEIKHYQYLDPEGRLTAKKLPAFAKKPDELVEMYKMMSFVRVFDNKAIALQRTGQLGTYASCLGHEAIHVGIGAAMVDEDVFCPMYREYGAQFWRGVKPHEVLLFWGGDERGNNFSGPQQDFPWCVPIATQNHHATGAAFALKYQGKKAASVSVIGDGGTSQGDFYESLNCAGAWDLPTVFVVANNKWAISVPLEIQTKCETLAQKGIAGGLDCYQVDGNDIIAVRDVMEQALTKARAGKGAALVEALTYRLSDHTTADDASRYRPNEEVEENWKKEPLIRIRNYLTETGAWDDKREEAWLAECAAKVDEEVTLYKEAGKPPVTDIFDHMFANMPEELAEQRRQAIEEAEHHG
ncbi:MAG: pyruvate dehydrogenase (acetyl-transferring) E1 component subunit alpha [Gammaproteobacteria bacterium]|nr:pyruvate dehydrogenase (acetyl-transferring) E1 component subunit alpha [Gammaproteobacteria bacterium]